MHIDGNAASCKYFCDQEHFSTFLRSGTEVCLQLGLCRTYNLHQSTSIAQANLLALYLGLEPDLLKSVLDLPGPPHRRHQLVARFDRARKSRLELLQVCGVARTQVLQQAVACRVERVQAVNDVSPKAHLLAGLGRRVQRVVVAIQSVQQRRLAGGLVLKGHIGCLALGRGEVLSSGALGTTPVALGDEEGATDGARVDLAGAGVDELGGELENGAWAALVVDAEDLGADFKVLALRGGGQRLQELDQALAVDHAGVVEVGGAWDLDGFLGGVEVDDFLGGTLECCGEASVGVSYADDLLITREEGEGSTYAG